MSDAEFGQAAIETIKSFLAAMEDRDLERASSFLSKDFQMLFPGGETFRELGELVAWAKPRYQWVKKDYERFDHCSAGSETIVYCYGTLYGKWPDESEFKGIRFIDRIVVKDGKLTDQKVWNDLAEVVSRDKI